MTPTKRAALYAYIHDLEAKVSALSPIQPAVGGMTDAAIRDLWLYRRDLHNGDLMLQLMDFARALLASTSPAQTGEPAGPQLVMCPACFVEVSPDATRQTGGVDQAWVDRAMTLGKRYGSVASMEAAYGSEFYGKAVQAAREALRTHLSTALGAAKKE